MITLDWINVKLTFTNIRHRKECLSAYVEGLKIYEFKVSSSNIYKLQFQQLFQRQATLLQLVFCLKFSFKSVLLRNVSWQRPPVSSANSLFVQNDRQFDTLFVWNNALHNCFLIDFFVRKLQSIIVLFFLIPVYGSWVNMFRVTFAEMWDYTCVCVRQNWSLISRRGKSMSYNTFIPGSHLNCTYKCNLLIIYYSLLGHAWHI